jgi:hypothetical protein
MFPFWTPVIAPVLAAADARRVVEIGALRGDNTRQIIDQLGPGSVLHVIDPVPGFDPSAHEREFPGRYVFHQALSLDVLGDLAPMDAALVDGDHNWHTVYHELGLLRQVARDAGAPLPVLVLHDVGWPYGRRDLYYDPATIPPEHRHPHQRAGMRPGRRELLPDGEGMSSGLWNAEREGGPRNGVMTALEDFVAEHDRRVRTVVLPLYFGLAIVVEEERLARQPALAAELDRIEGAEGSRALLELGELIRVRGVAHHHTVARKTAERHTRLADRYLDAVGRELTLGDRALAERLTELRRALGALSPTVPGDIVVVGDGVAAEGAMAAAHLVAHEVTGRTVRVVEASPTGPDPVRNLLVELELQDAPVEVVPAATALGDLAHRLGPVALVYQASDLANDLRPVVVRLVESAGPTGTIVVSPTALSAPRH